jgi:plastocyanin
MKKSIGSKGRLFIGISILFAILSLSNSCSKSSMSYATGTGGNGSKGSGNPGANEVWIQNMAFNPSTITIYTGTSIIWTNMDGNTHHVTSDTGLFDSGDLNPNGTYSYMFSTAGSYSYHCSIHPAMTATVIVKDIVAPGY